LTIPSWTPENEIHGRNAREILLTLYQIDPEHPRMLPLLLACVEIPPSYGHEVSPIDIIGRMGARAKDALPALERLMQGRRLQAALQAYVPAADSWELPSRLSMSSVAMRQRQRRSPHRPSPSSANHGGTQLARYRMSERAPSPVFATQTGVH
jgi:hypothetical protein